DGPLADRRRPTCRPLRSALSHLRFRIVCLWLGSTELAEVRRCESRKTPTGASTGIASGTLNLGYDRALAKTHKPRRRLSIARYGGDLRRRFHRSAGQLDRHERAPSFST